ncbi:MAG: hypothetical protein ACUVXF_00935 [Desulfobaccales bacterium]
MLPTILFILVAYALYALVMWWCHWQRAHLWARRNQTRSRWLTLLGSAGILALFLGLLIWVAPVARDQNLKLAGILGLSETEVRLAEQASALLAPGEPGARASNRQPAYALLHPASPPSLQPPAKPVAGSLLRKPRGNAASREKPLQLKADVRQTKKDKAPAKVKTGKKKTS